MCFFLYIYFRSGLSIRAAGRKYDIPEATLRNKKHRKTPVRKQMGPKPLLTEAEEAVLVAYIKGSARRAHPVTKDNVINAVTTILHDEEAEGTHRQRPHLFHEGPKRKWWRLFTKRHPEICFRTPETLTTCRQNVSEAVIRQWFADAHSYFSEEDMLEALHDACRNFNIDESGFSLSPKHGKVLAIKGENNFFEVSRPKYKSTISVLATVSANGEIPPPMIIYPRKRISYQMAEQIPENYLCAVGKK